MTPPAPAQADNLRGILLMVASMAGFAMQDMFIKWMAADLPTGQILLVLGALGLPIFALMARLDGRQVFTRDALHPAVLVRNLGEVVGTCGFITALALIPLSTMSAVFQAMPLVVTMGAALFLGEAVGWRRWTAIGVGCIGVLLIIRPGTDGFRIEALWALLAVAGLGLRDLASRRVPKAISNTQLSAWGFGTVALLGVGMLTLSGGAVLPSPVQSVQLVAAVGFGVAAYWGLTAASRLGEVAAVTPFRYSRLVFAMIIGVLVFGERPDALTLAGAGLIIGSGLYSFARERNLARARKRALHSTAAAG